MKFTLVLILSFFIFSCSKEVSDAGEVISNTVTGEIETISEPPEAPIVIGKKRIIIGNRKDESNSSSKKDNNGYLQVGNWSQSTIPGHKDTISRYSDDPAGEVSYLTSKVSAERYCVSVYQITHPNSISEAKYEIFDDSSLIETKILNPKVSTSAKGWTHLGIFSFPSQTGKVVLSRGANADNGFLRADEVRFLRLKDGFDCMGRVYRVVKKNAVIDNRKDINLSASKKDTTGYRQSGTWEQSVLPGFRDLISRYSNDKNAYATYKAKIAEDKDYCLKFFKVVHSNSSVIEVSITVNGNLLQTLDFDLALETKGWESLGIHSFQKDDLVEIKIKRADNNDGKVLRADAVRFLSNLNSCS